MGTVLKKILDENDISKILNCSTENAVEIMMSKEFSTLQVGNRRIVLKSEFDKWLIQCGGKESKAQEDRPKIIYPEKLRIGSNLKRIREDAKLTTRELGEMFGVTGSAISHWECDDNNPSLAYLKKYRDLFNINYHILLKEKDDQ